MFPEDVLPQDGNNSNDDYIDVVESSQVWTTWRDAIAISMFNDWNIRHGLA